MKIAIHTLKNDFFGYQKCCVPTEIIDNYNDLQNSDLIYIFSDELVVGPKFRLHSVVLKNDIVIVLRRNNYLICCTINGCCCGGLVTNMDVLKNVVFDGLCKITSIELLKRPFLKEGPPVVEMSLERSDRVYPSGFGVYVRHIIKNLVKIVNSKPNPISYLKKAKIENTDIEDLAMMKTQKVHIHCCEYESVVSFFNLKKVKLFGEPTSNDWEFILRSDFEQAKKELDERLRYETGAYTSNMSLEGTFNNKYIGFNEVIVNDYKEGSEIILNYELVTRQESFDKYKDKYPFQFYEDKLSTKLQKDESIRLGFKYSTYVRFEHLFKKEFPYGTTLLDIGAGFLYRFMRTSGIDVVVPEYEDVSYAGKMIFQGGIKPACVLADPQWSEIDDAFDVDEYCKARMRGFANKYILLPRKAYKDLRLKLVFGGNSFGLYKMMMGIKLIESRHELLNRQFRSSVERKHICRMNMFDDEKPNLKIALFAPSNMRNFSEFKQAKKKRESLLNGQYLIMMIGAEPYGRLKNININNKRPKINSYNDVIDFTIYNVEAAMINADFISVKDLEVMVSPNSYYFYDESGSGSVNYNIVSDEVNYYGFITNIFTSGIQNVANSPSMNKSVSTYIKSKFCLDEESLHRTRFEMLKSISGYSDLKFHEPDMWSLAYYEEKKGSEIVNRYIDVSGHILNLILASTLSIKNIRGYFRMKAMNISKVSLPISKLEKLIENVANGEDRGNEFKNAIWHTAVEDYRGCQIAGLMQKMFNLPNVDITFYTKKIDQLKYPKRILSIPVAHDIKISKRNYNGLEAI
jgi:hypothetical protein